jgi:antitoxin FitA
MHASRMRKMLQVRNVPERLHRRLKVLAAERGMTLSGYVLEELERLADQPTIDEWLERVRTREPARLKRSAAEWVREDRESH